MTILADVQKLNPGNRVRLIEIDGTAFGADVLRFHNCPLEPATTGESVQAVPIYWQGNRYELWPYDINGIAASTSGTSAMPKLQVSNVNGVVSALCLAFDDMVKAKVTIYDTMVDYLDAANFPGGNPLADSSQDFKQVFYIDSKSRESKEMVEFTLSSPFDLQGMQIPVRQLHSVCQWCMNGWYRTGKGCDYNGTAYFDVNGNPVSDPAQDECGGLVSDCKKRFGANNELSFGGFAGSALIKG